MNGNFTIKINEDQYMLIVNDLLKGRKTCYGSNDIKMISGCCNRKFFASKDTFKTLNIDEISFICPHCGWKSVKIKRNELNKEWHEGEKLKLLF